MRFYPLLAAFAAVVIGHNVNASLDSSQRIGGRPNIVPYFPNRYQGFGPLSVSAMKNSMNRAREILKEYESRRSQRRPVGSDEKVKNFTEFIIEEITRDSNVAEHEGKDVNQCLRTLGLGINNIRSHYKNRRRKCLRKNKPYIPVDLKILLLRWTGDKLAHDLEEFPRTCYNSTLTECRSQLESTIGEWELEVAALVNDEQKSYQEEADIVSHCHSLLFDEFQEHMNSLKIMVRECIAILPRSG